jgi:hypothetical protein
MREGRGHEGLVGRALKDRYRVGPEIGHGGMARVHSAGRPATQSDG